MLDASAEMRMPRCRIVSDAARTLCPISSARPSSALAWWAHTRDEFMT